MRKQNVPQAKLDPEELEVYIKRGRHDRNPTAPQRPKAFLLSASTSKFEMPTSPLQGYDQIVAVSQGHINMSLDAHFSDEKLLQWEVKNELGKITAHMLPPTVALVVPDEPAKTHFMLNLDSGTFTYYSPNGYPNVVHTTNWTLAFIVNLSLDAIDKLPEKLAEKIKFKGSYSVSQLLLDFSTPELISFNYDLSSTPGLLAESSDTLLALIRRYLQDQVHAPSHNVLGYAITVPEPAVANKIAPSFPPTSVRFQTVAHQPTSPANDCILFLEMTDKRAFPNSYIGSTPNWIEEDPLDPHHAGSMVLSKRNFWDRFFVPNSTFLNVSAVHVLSIVLDETREPGSERDDLSLRAPADYAWQSTTAQGMKWEWELIRPFVDDNNRSHSHHCYIQVDVTLDITKNAIVTNCTGYVVQNDGNNDDWVIDANITYGFEFTLDNVANGALGFGAKVNPEPDCQISNLGLSDIAARMTAAIKGRLQEHLDGMVKSSLLGVNDAFKHQAQFVFPGSGTFEMKDPSFNEAGDIVVGLIYKQE
ncbi:hypothetical protein MSAN_01893600 [Mycena sanguinolenta]|uniref:Uncharacterized protein n=1 Tax=Mycena sanguinolenta TaxID=230812 RepID=A0A8H6XPN4_9AGAR|nr:hypothetical protein MSAN_01893600 [Mycena sanguinolenta]